MQPSNFLVDHTGTVQLVDFGNAGASSVAQGPELPQPAVTRGTPQFMSPAVAKRGSADAADDLWSLGAVTLFLLTGRVPWQDRQKAPMVDEAILANMRSAEQCTPPVPTSLPSAVRSFIAACFDSKAGCAGNAAAQALLLHPWIASAVPATVPSSTTGFTQQSMQGMQRGRSGIRRGVSAHGGAAGGPLPLRTTSAVLPPSGMGALPRSGSRRFSGIAMERNASVALTGLGDSSSEEDAPHGWAPGLSTMPSATAAAGASSGGLSSTSLGFGSGRHGVPHAPSSEAPVSEHSSSSEQAQEKSLFRLNGSISGPLSARALTAPVSTPAHAGSGVMHVQLGLPMHSAEHGVRSGRFGARANTGMSVQFTQVMAQAISADTDVSGRLPNTSGTSSSVSSHNDTTGVPPSPAMAPIKVNHHVVPGVKYSGKSSANGTAVKGIAAGKRRTSGVALPSSPTADSGGGAEGGGTPPSQPFEAHTGHGLQQAVTPVPSNEPPIHMGVTPLSPAGSTGSRGGERGGSPPSTPSGQRSLASLGGQLPPVRIFRGGAVGSGSGSGGAAGGGGGHASSLATNDGFVVESHPMGQAAGQGQSAGPFRSVTGQDMGLSPSLAHALVGADSFTPTHGGEVGGPADEPHDKRQDAKAKTGGSGRGMVGGGGSGGGSQNEHTTAAHQQAPAGVGSMSPPLDPKPAIGGAGGGSRAGQGGSRVLSAASHPGPVNGAEAPGSSARQAGTLGVSGLWRAARGGSSSSGSIDL